MSVHEWLGIVFIVAGIAATAGGVAMLARTSATVSTENQRDIQKLRDRIIVIETSLGIPSHLRD